MDEPKVDVKEIAGEETSVEAPSAEEPKATEEVETPSAEPEIKTEETEETQTETVEAPKKGAQSRIRELNGKVKSLSQRLAELTGSGEPTAPQAPQIPQIDAGQEVSQDQYRQHVIGTANALVDLKIKQSEAVNRINNEANEVVRLYPQLDPSSDQYDKELSDSVTEATEAYVKAQPYTASPKKFVSKLMQPYERAVIKEVGKVSENLAKQVSQTATRPTSVTSAGGKTDADLSIADLEKKYGVHVS